MNLVIVESPSKASTIKKFLGDDYKVTASLGHIKDLPEKELGVDLSRDFAPHYRIIPSKNKVVETIRQLAESAERVYIATDPDREGEAIAAHIAEIIHKTHPKPYRALFYEITRNAVQKAIATPGIIDVQKVDAQVARRVVDRLVGYQVSPFIWKTVAKGLSAGRVQSVALRMICEREAEIRAFVPTEYWSIRGLFAGDKLQPLWAEFTSFAGKKLELPTAETTLDLAEKLLRSTYAISQVKVNQQSIKPYAPYITSTLQQDAGRRISLSPKKTMSLAQMLYEGVDLPGGESTGLITYMRTDSTRIAAEAQHAARDFIAATLGENYNSPKPRHYAQKKSAQGAHEAIRPTDVARTPKELKNVLDPELWKLYDLIWRRFVASQMADTVNEVTIVDIQGDEALFRIRWVKRIFDGFQKVYALESSGEEPPPNLPPNFGKGYPLCLDCLDPRQHFTQPPPRYTESSLIKALDELGIGRPSTYATILTTLYDRTYVKLEKPKLLPTSLGETVNKILVALFPDIFEVGFTARMEEHLDQIEEGASWVNVIKDFYTPFALSLENAEKHRRSIKEQVQEVSDQVCEKCGKPMLIKWSRRGKFLACSGFPKCHNSKPLETPKTVEKACPDCGGALNIKEGRFGRFLGCSNYPTCRHVEPIGTGVKCPEPDCGGELVERSTKKGRFYSCSRYPQCKFHVTKRPIPKECPACGHPFLVVDKESGGSEQISCPKCRTKFEPFTEPETEPIIAE
ncbi:MAG: type I DNA topoisomerase [bacterium]|nr:type I DNA topoisomerase [bacterium]